jgi:type II secretory ATPase GspE/PulE/Tfp pilus assembly ATPase PilB-like protein
VLAPAINAIIGQRLVRKICTACKESYKPSEIIRQRVEMILKTIPKTSQADLPSKLSFYHSLGCKDCKGLGYKGRIGVYEVFNISEVIEKLILRGATTTEVRSQAIAEGMITMAQDGLLKAMNGITDVEEVFRVVEE